MNKKINPSNLIHRLCHIKNQTSLIKNQDLESMKNNIKEHNKERNKDKMADKETEKKGKVQAQAQALTVQAPHLQIPHHNQKMKEEKDVKTKEAIVKMTERTIEGKVVREKTKDQDQRTERLPKKEKSQDMDHPDMMIGTGIEIEKETENKRREVNAVEAETINVLVDDHDCITLN